MDDNLAMLDDNNNNNFDPVKTVDKETEDEPLSNLVWLTPEEKQCWGPSPVFSLAGLNEEVKLLEKPPEVKVNSRFNIEFRDEMMEIWQTDESVTAFNSLINNNINNNNNNRFSPKRCPLYERRKNMTFYDQEFPPMDGSGSSNSSNSNSSNSSRSNSLVVVEDSKLSSKAPEFVPLQVLKAKVKRNPIADTVKNFTFNNNSQHFQHHQVCVQQDNHQRDPHQNRPGRVLMPINTHQHNNNNNNHNGCTYCKRKGLPLAVIESHQRHNCNNLRNNICTLCGFDAPQLHDSQDCRFRRRKRT